MISSEEPIPFAENVHFFTQADPFEDFIVDRGLTCTGPLTWYYLNEEALPPDPGGNPVREPFLFQVGYEITEPPEPQSVPSETRGRYLTRPLRPLRVASVFYRGSFPHQEHSGFGESWMTLVDQAESLGYRLTLRLYREIYHHLDYDDPSQSVTEIHVEIAT